MADFEKEYNPDLQRTFFDGLTNDRDLGGMPNREGQLFRKKVFLRTDSPSDLTESQIEAIKNYGVRTVIDLRSETEFLNFGNPFSKDPDVRFYNIPLFVGDPNSQSDDTMKWLATHRLGDFYVIVLEQLGDRVAQVLRVLKDNTDGICMYHCAQGKDRTGIITALLYLLHGASDENIILNYRVSYEYGKEVFDKLLVKLPPNMQHTMRSDSENMVIMLDFMKKNYNGDVTSYMRKIGMSDEEIRELKNRFC